MPTQWQKDDRCNVERFFEIIIGNQPTLMLYISFREKHNPNHAD